MTTTLNIEFYTNFPDKSLASSLETSHLQTYHGNLATEKF